MPSSCLEVVTVSALLAGISIGAARVVYVLFSRYTWMSREPDFSKRPWMTLEAFPLMATSTVVSSVLDVALYRTYSFDASREPTAASDAAATGGIAG